MGFDFPGYSQPDLTSPMREIELSTEQEKMAQEAISTLANSGLTVDGLFAAFQDWQTRRTIVSRRFFLSVAALVGGSYWVGVDLSNARFLGLALGDGNLLRFIALLGFILLVSGAMFLFSRGIDKAVRAAKIQSKLRSIEPCTKAAKELDQLVSAIGLSSTEDLLYDFRERIITHHSDQDAYEAAHFYETNLKRSHIEDRIMESAELIGVALVGIYALYALIMMAFA